MAKIYKVGGSVRDKLLGRNATDNDYVVVGSTPTEMEQQGFKPVGKDFPVFLHPNTHEEYALARAERKISIGYRGFQFYVSPEITLADDLKRRDITINAIAEDEHGNLIDPFNGIADLKNKIIRHVSEAFIEDPLRVLRAARFSASFGFAIAPETLKLMGQIVISGELLSLSRERINQEYKKALNTEHTQLFFNYLYKINGLTQIFPEFTPLVENNNLWLNFLHFIKSSSWRELNLEQRFSLIYYFIAQADPNINLVNYIKIASFNSKCSELALLLTSQHDNIINLNKFSAPQIECIMQKLDYPRKKERYNNLVKIINIVNQDDQVSKNITLLNNINNEFKKIDYKKFNQADHQQFLAQIKQIKLTIIRSLIKLAH